VHDPVVPVSAAVHPDIKACASPLEAAQGADALVIMTPWQVYRELRADKLAQMMVGRTVIDPYQVLDGAGAAAAGLDYFTLGASSLRATGPRTSTYA
jgi:UDPglucose 6-dehydrogenase